MGPIKILSIGGGGIRGIIPALVYELFDLIAGTSPGGILALGLTSPALPGMGAYKTVMTRRVRIPR